MARCIIIRRYHLVYLLHHLIQIDYGLVHPLVVGLLFLKLLYRYLHAAAVPDNEYHHKKNDCKDLAEVLKEIRDKGRRFIIDKAKESAKVKACALGLIKDGQSFEQLIDYLGHITKDELEAKMN